MIKDTPETIRIEDWELRFLRVIRLHSIIYHDHVGRLYRTIESWNCEKCGQSAPKGLRAIAIITRAT